ALEQPWVGDRELGRGECEIVVGEDVNIDRARAPAALARPVTPERALDRLRALEQSPGSKHGYNGDAQVHERRLGLDAPRRGRVVGRAGGEPDLGPVAKPCDRAIERGARVAQIATERQQRLSHGASARW